MQYDRLYTPKEVGKVLRVDPRTVTRWATEGRLEHVRTPGGQVRVTATVLRERFGIDC